MKKILRIITVWILLLGLTLTAAAAELASCRISADSVTGMAGEQVTVPIRITDNPGFTNFGIALDYDREKLTLISIQLEDAQQEPYLCGRHGASNIAWNPAQDAAGQNAAYTENTLYGYVICAHAEAVKTNGILFTATFRLADDFEGTAAVMPIVNYMRNNEADFSVFETIAAHSEQGMILLDTETVLVGDVNQDGYITADDAATAFAASKGAMELTDAQKAAADANADGYITADDAAQIFAMSKSNQ